MLPLARFQHRALCSLLTGLLVVPAGLSAAAPPAKNQSPPETWQIYQGRYPAIHLHELRTAMAAGTVTLIDANRPETYHKNHIPKALSLAALIAQETDHGLPASRKSTIVVYCGGPQCMSWFKAADFATKQGYKNVRYYPGGLKEWMDNHHATASTFP